MPLTAFQESVARLLSLHRDSESYLAGGAAMHLAPQSLRYSNDLDYFQDSEARVARAFDEDQVALLESGFQVTTLLDRPGFVRALVTKGVPSGDGSTKVEWVHDTAWRFMPVVKNDIVGMMLHPVDLAINKVLALVGRDEPRDFLDTLDVHERVLPLGAMVWAAAGKDPGFSPGMLLDLLRRRGKLRNEDLSRLRLTAPVELTFLKQRWLLALDEASEFVAERPPEELGCLYYRAADERFVQPQPGEAVTPHYGRPGGVVPIVSDV